MKNVNSRTHLALIGFCVFASLMTAGDVRADLITYNIVRGGYGFFMPNDSRFGGYGRGDLAWDDRLISGSLTVDTDLNTIRLASDSYGQFNAERSTTNFSTLFGLQTAVNGYHDIETPYGLSIAAFRTSSINSRRLPSLSSPRAPSASVLMSESV